MATKLLELKVVLEPTLMKGVDYLARVEGVSSSKLLRDFIKKSLKTLEKNPGERRKVIPNRDIIFAHKKTGHSGRALI